MGSRRQRCAECKRLVPVTLDLLPAIGQPGRVRRLCFACFEELKPQPSKGT